MTDMPVQLIENRVFDDIAIGDSASLTRRVTLQDIELFSIISGDINPAHLDAEYAATDMFHHIIAQGVLTAGLISAVLGTKLPGPGTIYLGQDLQFRAPVSPGDTITATVTVTERNPEKHRLSLDCHCFNQDNIEVLRGKATVRAPMEKISRIAITLPEVRLLRHQGFRNLLARATTGAALLTAVAHPCDEASLRGAVAAANAGLITPILVGPEDKIRAVAQACSIDIAGLRIENTPHSHASAARAVALVRAGEARALMQGSLHTDELLHEVMLAQSGLHTGRCLSHVYVMDVPAYGRPLLVTDAAINIAPTLDDKVSIVQNAIDLAQVLGIENPKVAILAAVETINPHMQATLDAAALCKMVERGQITGGVLDGPLAYDDAVSLAAARAKHLTSAVAGQADILVAPNIEAGNILAKQLTVTANADAAGIVLGASVPIIFTSRADDTRTRLASCAIAVILAAHE
ncbi:MAG: enoyl-CoA hydratase [Acidocella sp. 20-57-95]|nr:MAG: enoyl-CoA hydratase [Acidocella sp. 20-57-95]OYV60063.1 MAG: enoyl-CoA hydratase [Acidocella sp. 21-58-7]HQT63975.1 bifunctional enoyl-CoA hydratase/phosphate acetyltransferase [Acidocella sp.]HQU04264.1 bifunctional enoyl-CoA hydratase/phosphate acetyltransferase [Acidocella sp.]